MDTQRVEISYKTIIFTVVFLLALWFLFQIKDALSLLFLSIIVAAGLRSPVNWLEERFHLPRMLAILITYIVFVSLLLILLYVMIPAFVQQTENLIRQLEGFFVSSGMFGQGSAYLDVSLSSLSNQLTAVTSNILRATLGAFSLIINFFTLLVLTFYMLLERRHMRVFLKNLLGEEMKERIVNVILRIETRLGAWVRGEVTLILIIGILSYIGLILLKIEYALPLAILAGILEIVPIVGPIISAIPAIIIALLVNPWLAVAVAALYFLIQQLENHLIVPQVMRQAVGIPPVVTILAIMVGGRLGGIGGALLAIPLFISLQILFQEFVSSGEQPLFPQKEKTEEKE